MGGWGVSQFLTHSVGGTGSCFSPAPHSSPAASVERENHISVNRSVSNIILVEVVFY